MIKNTRKRDQEGTRKGHQVKKIGKVNYRKKHEERQPCRKTRPGRDGKKGRGRWGVWNGRKTKGKDRQDMKECM